MRLVLVGTGHVFAIAEAIQSLIQALRPTIVALELDPARHQGLLERRAGRRPDADRERGVPRIYRYLAKYQEAVADSFGVQPGSEMLAATEAAALVGARVELIDRDAEAVVRDVVRRMRWTEKLRFAWTTLYASAFHRKRKTVEEELQRYHRDPEAYLADLGNQFPTVKRVLIDERNEHMAREVRRLLVPDASLLAVVGDGHVPGLARLLADLRPEVHRLRDLPTGPRSGSIEWRMSPSADRAGFSFTGQSLGDLRRPP